MTVWFPEQVERIMRLWLANVSHNVIAQVIGPDITGQAVQDKARRAGMPARPGLTLIRDIEAARDIDRQAAPLPKVIYDHHNKPKHLKICGMAGMPCYTYRNQHYSPQYRETKRYKNGESASL